MSEVVQLYKDKEKQIKAYPKTLASEVYMSDGVTSVESSLENNTKQKVTWINIVEYAKQKNYGDITKGGTDIGCIVNEIINILQPNLNGNYTGLGGGTVFIPTGDYLVSTSIILKSGISIKGEIDSWLLVDPNLNGFAITSNTFVSNGIYRVGTSIENISIGITKDISQKYTDNVLCSGIFLNYSSGKEYLRDVNILGLKNGVVFNNAMDTHLSHIEVKGCNVNVIMKNASSVRDTNAINVHGLRSEGAVTSLLQLVDIDKTGNQVRSIQFGECKFEGIAPIIIEGARDIKFIGCNFVTTLTDDYMIKIANGTLCTTQTDSVSFTGCSFIGANETLSKFMSSGSNTYPVTLTGCTYYNLGISSFYGGLCVNGGEVFKYSNNSFNVATISGIHTGVAVINGANASQIDTIKTMLGEYNVKASSTNSEYYSGLYNETDDIGLKLGSNLMETGKTYKNTNGRNLLVSVALTHSKNCQIIIANQNFFTVPVKTVGEFETRVFEITLRVGDNIKFLGDTTAIINTLARIC